VPDKLIKGMNRGTVTLHTDNKDYPTDWNFDFLTVAGVDNNKTQKWSIPLKMQKEILLPYS